MSVKYTNFHNMGKRAGKALKHSVALTALDVQSNLSEEAPTDHGRLSGSFQTKRLNNLNWLVYTPVHYADYVLHGTGIYGPKKRPITPKKAKALVFKVKGKTVFAKSVKGQKPDDYVGRAVEETNKDAKKFVRLGLKKEGLI